MLFPTIPFVIFFLAVLPLSWLLLPLFVDRKDWLHRLPWKIFILIASYIFLGFGQPSVTFLSISLPLPCTVLAISVVANHFLVKLMMDPRFAKIQKSILVFTVSANVAGLGYFKYRNFVVEQTYNFFGNTADFPRLSSLIIPIAISFFTFQAISYVVDTYRGTIERVPFLDFAVFLSFFPHLVAGPIVRASEFIPQLRNPHNPRAVDATKAATLIARGLFKKMVIADLLYTQIVRPSFGAPGNLDSFEALMASYAYAAQLYADFSGYTDIAIGIALLLGFRFPQNFNRPYTASSIRDFWQRWHMTLSRWLRDYVYIPLGGNKTSFIGSKFIWINVVLTMAIGGLWHGANTTFVVWGLYHGVVLVVERLLRNFNDKHNIVVPLLFRRILTFHVVTFGWIIFASESLESAWLMITRIFVGIDSSPSIVSFAAIILILCGIGIQFLPPALTNRVSNYVSTRPIPIQALFFGIGLMLLSAMSGHVSAFVYGFF